MLESYIKRLATFYVHLHNKLNTSETINNCQQLRTSYKFSRQMKKFCQNCDFRNMPIRFVRSPCLKAKANGPNQQQQQQQHANNNNKTTTTVTSAHSSCESSAGNTITCWHPVHRQAEQMKYLSGKSENILNPKTSQKLTNHSCCVNNVRSQVN